MCHRFYEGKKKKTTQCNHDSGAAGHRHTFEQWMFKKRNKAHCDLKQGQTMMGTSELIMEAVKVGT